MWKSDAATEKIPRRWRLKFDFHAGDDPEDRQARKYVGSALKPAKKAALERLVEQLQRDNDRLQASLQLAYERAEAAKQEWEAVRSRRPTSVPSLQYESSPGVMDVGGLFFDFDAPRRNAKA